MTFEIPLLTPDWPAPPNVGACVSLREGPEPFGAANLALHVGDDPQVVRANRAALARATGVANWQWLNQVHGTELVRVSPKTEGPAAAPDADGSITAAADLALAVLTADCLPLLICARDGSEVAAVHAGWRGLAAGILKRAVRAFAAEPEALLVYIGPAIGPRHYQVDAPVLEAFSRNPELGDGRASEAFAPSPGKPDHWQCDLAALARSQLQCLGVQATFGGDTCTYADARFYSYRRDGRTGRFACAIWRT